MYIASKIPHEVGDFLPQVYSWFTESLIQQPMIILEEVTKQQYINFFLEICDKAGYEPSEDPFRYLEDYKYFYRVSTD